MINTRVVLRPVTQADLDLFEAEFSGPEGTGVHQWFGYRSPVDLRRRFAETGLLTPDGGTLTVCAEDGDVAGRVEWFKSSWGRPETSWCWTVAIGLRPSCQGRGIGTEAQRLLVAYLFDHTRAQRIQAFTDSGNLAEQRALEKAGFEREGVLRQAQWRAGHWHDQVLYSTLRPTTVGDEGRGADKP
ncbi:GNAT family N-acetyltransferase [Actinoallomurus sp. NBC_01490]|uniref:GNAT family N-acetyltransferase n=1 Tax=Actinoallomurus sp. NBC_01490 TaxID=2903557 RepID=UPI002E30FF85|nr:GNAT family protein [Actinoallomurus sp. NBC_01490]